MSRKTLLSIAAFFALFTCLGHSVGTLPPMQPQTEAVGQARAVMESAMVPMPIGPARSLAQLAYGGNVMISLYLLIAGLMFVVSAKPQRYVGAVVLLNGAGLAACAVIASVFFFPLPAICTAISAALGFFATRRPQ